MISAAMPGLTQHGREQVIVGLIIVQNGDVHRRDSKPTDPQA
jgi:hypothetical protein